MISARISGVSSKSAAANEGSNCAALRAPMMGAVTAGCEPTQAIAKSDWMYSYVVSEHKMVKRSAMS